MVSGRQFRTLLPLRCPHWLSLSSHFLGMEFRSGAAIRHASRQLQLPYAG